MKPVHWCDECSKFRMENESGGNLLLPLDEGERLLENLKPGGSHGRAETCADRG